MPKPVVLVMLSTVLALGACGGDPLDLEPDEGGQRTVEAEEERGTTASEAGKDQEPAGEPGVETKPAKRRLIYLDARTLCDEFGVRQIVRRFGVKPGAAADVARAYSEQNYSAAFRRAGYRGCLAGFRE